MKLKADVMTNIAKDNHNEKSCSHCATDIFEKKEPLWKERKAHVLILSFIILILGLLLEFVFYKEAIFSYALYFLVFLSAGHEIIKKAYEALLKKRLDINVLITIAAIGAFLTGNGEEGASVIFLFAIAEFLEDYAAEKARNAIGELLKLTPEIARVKRNGKELEVHVHELKINEVVIIKPGDKLPVDGIVYNGSSFVNQAPITGESVPVNKNKGDSVYAGTINGEGYLEVKMTKAPDQSLIARITSIVENAQKQKSSTEKFIDKFASYYTPLIIILAVAIAIIPTLIFGQPFEVWIYRALILLVVACPCALAISTPMSLVSALTSAAKNGLLVKGGAYIEEIAKTKAIILDKTGTLTKGVFEVVEVIPVSNISKDELLKVSASLESSSTHPIAAAIVKKATKNLYKVKNFVSITGKGIKGIINGQEYLIGNLKLPVKIDENSRTIMERLEAEGKTVVIVATKEKVIGIIAISDKIRKEAHSFIQELIRVGITPIMLTGDNEQTAKAIAKELRITHYHASLLPEQKLEEVKKLREQYKTVVMVGDGVNDAPALAAANVGLAMGAIGSDVAIETADVAILKDDLTKIPFLIKLSKKTMVVIQENIVASVLIKGSIGLLAFLGVISLWIAVAFGDMGLSLLVIINALRIGFTKLRLPF